MTEPPEALTFRNELDTIGARFIACYKRGDAMGCAEGYTVDAIILMPGTPPIRGRTEIAASIQAAMDSGLQIESFTTTHAEADGSVGYATQIQHGSNGDGHVMLAMRRDEDGLWAICCEAVLDE
ncbi:MAG: hypothetical protein JNJ53_01445 [Rhizobiales bacterium]|nr:hypothetical protein [Hyphomicrobiales bacterium]